jgi:uncharacterized membrane protein (UPF0127 family)
VGAARYRVLNRTRNNHIAVDAECADTLFSRLRGLMARPSNAFTEGQGLWILPSEGIHTFGMRFPIDAAYLDAKGKILRVYHGLRPWRLAAVTLRARSVLELPAGTLKRTGTEAGDVLEFIMK